MPRTRMRMSDLPEKLVVEIFKRVPITSLKAVRSTCKTWEAITKKWVIWGKEAPHQFLTMNNKVYSLRYNLDEEDLVVDDVSVKQVDLFNQLEICGMVYHCDGLMLCVAKDRSKLVVWNPYLCQTRWIGPRLGENFNGKDTYAIGYSEDDDKKRDHKILKLLNDYNALSEVTVFRCEIYEMSSSDSSWRVLKVKQPEWEIDFYQRGVSVNGNTYFVAHQKYDDMEPEPGTVDSYPAAEDFLLCFDFTKEKFGPPLTLPFHSYGGDCTTLSSFLRRRDDDDDEEQLAVLFGALDSSSFEIWVTLTVEPKYVSWTKFLLVETGPPLNFMLTPYFGGSFFVDEENDVAVVCELDGQMSTTTQHTAFVFGKAGYIKSVNLGQCTKLQHLCPYSGKPFEAPLLPPLVCSSTYRPSLVQLKQPLQPTHV